MKATFISTVVVLVLFYTGVNGQDDQTIKKGEEGLDTEYPQYLYKPDNYQYGFDCNRRLYGEYQVGLRRFKREWYGDRYNRYEIPDEYRRDWTTYGGKYKPYKDYVDLTVNIEGKPNPCCWEFNNKKIRKRKLDKDLKKKRVRMEYRQLTDSQRAAFHDALNDLKDDGTYDVFVSNHRQINAPYAHNGASFLPWHREFLFRLENALIKKGYELGLPYFDSTLDQSLPSPKDSAVWTDDYLGNNDGTVVTGFAKHWESVPECKWAGPSFNLTRLAVSGPLGQCYLYSDSDVNYVYTKRCFRDITCNTDCKFEADHAGAHNFVGGHMAIPNCAPSDPFFFLHHAFVDCIWEEFRQNHQESDIHREYPSQVNGDNVGTPPFGSPNGFEWDAQMLPFPGLVNGHGIQSFYTTWYKCKPRPMKCVKDVDCGSDILWCHNGRCKAKVKLGGDCTGLPHIACAGVCPGIPIGAPPCCLNGVCQCCFKG